MFVSRHKFDTPDTAEAALVLSSSFDERATEEALIRAFLAERGGDRRLAKYWIEVYGQLTVATSHLQEWPAAPGRSGAREVVADCHGTRSERQLP